MCVCFLVGSQVWGQGQRAREVIAVELMTSGDHLAAAHAQRAAMAKAKWSLYTVAMTALKAHRGFRLVSIVPSLTAVERPIAHVTMVRGDQWKTVAERLN
jgi:hypothetical protein